MMTLGQIILVICILFIIVTICVNIREIDRRSMADMISLPTFAGMVVLPCLVIFFLIIHLLRAS